MTIPESKISSPYPRDWRVLLRHPGMLWRSVPLTLAILAVILVAGLSTQTFARGFFPTLMHDFGWSLPALKAGRLYDLWFGLPFGSTPGHFYSVIGIGWFGVGALEYRRGTRWAAIGFLVIGPLASLVTTLLLWPIDELGIKAVHSFLYTPDMGSSSASLVCWGLLLGGEKGRLKQALLWGTILVSVLLLVILQVVWSVDHLVAFLIGLGVSLLFMSRSRAKPSTVDTVDENRGRGT